MAGSWWRRWPVAVGVLALAAAAARAQTEAEGNVGYIDSAIPRTQFRLRYDDERDMNRIYRAEFIYPKPGAFKTAPPPFTDPSAPGGDDLITRLDEQDVTGYLEVAVTDWLSGFVEVPQRFLHENTGENDTGIGDLNVGGKLALLLENEYGLTFQFRTYVPTGFVKENLSTGHVSLELALLWYVQPTDRLLIEGELRDWVPVGGTGFSGNVLRYGVGASYNVSWTEKVRISPVVEFVGWTVLSGKDLNPVSITAVESAAGQTIVNVKTGLRVALPHQDVYVGFGRALTGDVWYKDILRVEYRIGF